MAPRSHKRDNQSDLACINFASCNFVICLRVLAIMVQKILWCHYGDVIMGAMASQITSLVIVYSTVYSGADQRKHQSSASLAFVWGIHRWRVNSPKGSVNVFIWWRHHVPGQNVDRQKRRQPKYWQAESRQTKIRQTETSASRNRNVDLPKRRRNKDVEKPEHRQNAKWIFLIRSQ